MKITTKVLFAVLAALAPTFVFAGIDRGAPAEKQNAPTVQAAPEAPAHSMNAPEIAPAPAAPAVQAAPAQAAAKPSPAPAAVSKKQAKAQTRESKRALRKEIREVRAQRAEPKKGLLGKLKDFATSAAGLFGAAVFGLAGLLGPKWGPKLLNAIKTDYVKTGIILMVVGLLAMILGWIIALWPIYWIGGLLFFVGLLLFLLALLGLI